MNNYRTPRDKSTQNQIIASQQAKIASLQQFNDALIARQKELLDQIDNEHDDRNKFAKEYNALLKHCETLQVANSDLNGHCELLTRQNHKLWDELKQLQSQLKNDKKISQFYWELANEHEKLKIEYGQLQNHSLVLSRNLESVKQDYYTVDARYENLKSLVLKILELWGIDNGKKYLKQFEEKFEDANTFIKKCKLFSKIAIFLQD